MERIFDVNNISIHTLLIDGRKFTRSLFRQIPYGWLLDVTVDKFVVRGKPFGHVHYFWKGDEPPVFLQTVQGITHMRNTREHYHVLYEHEGRMYRYVVYERMWSAYVLFPDVERKWNEFWEKVRKLPQLFIAV
jgi:hypothetical protein